MTAPAEEDSSSLSARTLAARLSRSGPFGLALIGIGGGIGGFGAALLLGVPAGFSQPLATFLAGFGAVSAGVLAYVNGERSRALADGQHKEDATRERERHAEDSRRAQASTLRDRYATIAAQIADGSPAIRQAGVYALTALADDWHAFGEDDERQVCINLLQWYLRVPIPPDPNAPGPEAEPVVPDPNPSGSDPVEREIRQTIVGLIAHRRRLPENSRKSWRRASFDLSRVSLSGCNLSGLDLSGLDLISASLDYVDLSLSNLSGSDLRDADLTKANLSYLNVDTPRSGKPMILIRAVLPGAAMYRSRLAGADLTDADLSGADLGNSLLSRADLSGTDLRGADLAETVLTNVITDKFTKWPDGFTPPDSET